MPEYVTHTPSGLWVPNPVEPREKFADRWRDQPELARHFFGWLDRLGDDLRDAASHRGIDKVAARLQESFGAEPVEKAVGRLVTSTGDRAGVSVGPMGASRRGRA